MAITPRTEAGRGVLAAPAGPVRVLLQSIVGLGVANLTLLALRIGFGWFLFYAGWMKLAQEGGWSARDFLLYATRGPFVPMFHAMAGNVLIDAMVIAGELLVGMALIFGAATRLASLAGIQLFVMLYLARIPPTDGWISMHVVYMLVLAALFGLRAGAIVGVDALLSPLERRYPLLKWVLG